MSQASRTPDGRAPRGPRVIPASRATRAVIATDAFGRIRTWDRGAQAMFGKDLGEVRGRRIAEVVAGPSATVQALGVMQAMCRGESWSGRLALATQGASRAGTCQVTVDPVTDDDGLVVAGVWTCADTRAERGAELALKRLASLVESTGDAVVSMTLDGVITSWNAFAEHIYGYGAQETVGRHVKALVPDDRYAEMDAALDAIRRGEPRHRLETMRRRSDGTAIEVTVTMVPTVDVDGTVIGITAMSRDVTAQRQLERAYAHRDAHDDLTGLPNRRAAERRLETAVELAQVGEGSVAVLFVDIDRFATVNDAWGHAAGDVLLAELAQRMQRVLRDGDLIARFGGDEFVVICDGASQAKALDVASRLHKAVAEPVMLNGHRVVCSASIGVATTPPYDAEALMRFASAATVDAKQRGRARTRVYDTDLAHRAQTRLDFASGLGSALANDELELRYQPIFDVGTGHVRGVEALTRWVHPVHGTIAPSEFLQLAEDTGLIGHLDAWALRRACADAARMLKTGVLPYGAYVSVNLSERSLVDPRLATLVTEALAAAELPASALVLEVTETGMMTDPKAVAATLTALRERGVGIALDDFGTRHSSLAHLRQFPLTSLKIDRAFVASICDDADDLTIAASILDLARALGVTTVAVGVETRRQLDLLRRLGCPSAQGFLWSEAVSPAELGRLLTNDAGAPSRTLTPPYGDGDGDGRPPAKAPARRGDVTVEHGLRRLIQLQQEGQSPTTIAAALNAEGYRTPEGQRWHQRSVTRALARLAIPTS